MARSRFKTERPANTKASFAVGSLQGTTGPGKLEMLTGRVWWAETSKRWDSSGKKLRQR